MDFGDIPCDFDYNMFSPLQQMVDFDTSPAPQFAPVSEEAGLVQAPVSEETGLLLPYTSEPLFNYVPLPAAQFLDEKGFLPKEHRKSNHAALLTTLRRALFNDELIRFVKLMRITAEELDMIAERAWTDFARLKTQCAPSFSNFINSELHRYGQTDREVIRGHIYTTYRPGVAIPTVPEHRHVPPMDTIFVSGITIPL